MKAVVVASGDLVPGDLRHLDGAGLVVAADGGAIALDAAGCRVDRLVGDLDSVPAQLVERLATSGVHVERHETDKEASDTELAVAAAARSGALEIVLLGAIGGERLDHELANVLLLADPAFDTETRIVRGGTTIRCLRGDAALGLDGRPGDLVTLLPLGGDAIGVTAIGVRWPLDRATLGLGRSRGLSNVVTAADASVSIERGALLVVETRTAGENRS